MYGMKIEITPHVHLLYTVLAEKRFDFEITEIISTSDDGSEPEVESLVTGNCHFDGVRHIHFGEEGYLNYFEPKLWIKILTELDLLCEKYCDPSEYN